LIDLHMHTTASDGSLAPSELVALASAAGLTTISVTDHDTVAALAEVERCTTAAGITLVPGIEVTSVHEQRDVHVLGYFLDATNPGFARFLETQRRQREDRAREIAARLESLGAAIEVEPLIAEIARMPGVSIGRPVIARALVNAGHVHDLQEAFDRFLAAGQPAFVPRRGRKPAEVVDAIHAAGGLASLAHPGITRQPALVEPLARAGLDAIEAYHSDHTDAMRDDALANAKRFNLAITGGSDFHGEPGRRPLGGVALPRADFEALAARVAR
jgi:predicted metal-dependent phosphoesterase TrpH